MAELRRCARCVLPETHETITFDAEGVCNICRQQEYKQTQIDWAAKKRELDALIAEQRGKATFLRVFLVDPDLEKPKAPGDLHKTGLLSLLLKEFRKVQLKTG